jgi:hypothetical protein
MIPGAAAAGSGGASAKLVIVRIPSGRIRFMELG